MKIRRIIEAAASGCVVYGLAVACSGGGSGGGGALLDAANDVLGGGGSGGLIADVLGDPVSEAQAAPPEVKEAPCVDTGSGYFNAEVAFPGRTVNELARAAPLLHYPSKPNGYEWAKQASFGVKDGAVSVYCYSSSSGPVVDGVRVILPLN
jgi:hypothetical protein